MPTLTPDFLANIAIFRKTTEEERSQLLQVMTHEHYEKDDYVIRAGETSRGLHVVVEGAAVVTLDVEGYENPFVSGGEAQVVEHADLAKLEIGNTFGEVSFFHGGPHTANVQAVTSLDVFTLLVEDYQTLLGKQNLAAYKIGLNAAHILAGRLVTANKLISELILAQHEPMARSRWFDSQRGLHSNFDYADIRFFH